MGVQKGYYQGREEKLFISLADFLSFSWWMGTFSRFWGCYSDRHLWLCLCFSAAVRGVQVEQSPPSLILQEGASSMLWCNFSSAVNNVQWFRQNPGGRLINLFYIPSGTKWNGNLNATTDPKERRSSLHVSSSQTTDSAIYFCAASHSASQAPAAWTRTRSSSSNHTHLARLPHNIYTAQYPKPTLVGFQP